MIENPYAAPQTTRLQAMPDATPFDIARREAHLKHEAQLQSVGLLYALGALLWLLVSGAVLFAAFDRTRTGSGWMYDVIVAALMLAICAALAALAYGYRTLQPWVRIPGGLISGLGLLAVPIGTLINAWVLYLMFSAKGREVLSPDYQRVIKVTPGMRYRSKSVGAVILVLLLLVLAALLLPLFVSSR